MCGGRLSDGALPEEPRAPPLALGVRSCFGVPSVGESGVQGCPSVPAVLGHAGKMSSF